MNKHYTLISIASLICLLSVPAFASAPQEAAEPETEAVVEATTEAAAVETEEEETAGSYTPGTYEAKTKGYGGYIRVTVTIDEDGKIAEVKADGPDETPTVGGYALLDLPAQFIEKQSSDIDAYAGATFTRNALVEGVEDCLKQASGSEGAPAAYQPGTYEAKEKGYGGYITVTVTIDEEGKIAEVKANGPDETPTVGGYALTDLPVQFVEKQSTDIDAYAGATFTRNALVKAVEAALAQASESSSAE